MKQWSDKEIWRSPLIQAWLDYYFNKIFWFQVFQTILYFALIACFSVTNLHEEPDLFTMLAFLLVTYFATYEFIQFLATDKADFFKDPWNWLDIFIEAGVVSEILMIEWSDKEVE